MGRFNETLFSHTNVDVGPISSFHQTNWLARSLHYLDWGSNLTNISFNFWYINALPSLPAQMAVPSCWRPVWPTRRPLRSWSEPSWRRGFERWRKRTVRSDCSSANHRARLPNWQKETTAISSGARLQTRCQKKATTRQRRRTTTQTVRGPPPSRSVRSGRSVAHWSVSEVFWILMGPHGPVKATCFRMWVSCCPKPCLLYSGVFWREKTFKGAQI